MYDFYLIHGFLKINLFNSNEDFVYFIFSPQRPSSWMYLSIFYHKTFKIYELLLIKKNIT